MWEGPVPFPGFGRSPILPVFIGVDGVRAGRFGLGGPEELGGAGGVLGSIVVGKWLRIREFGWLAKGREGSEVLADFVRGSCQAVLLVPPWSPLGPPPCVTNSLVQLSDEVRAFFKKPQFLVKSTQT